MKPETLYAFRSIKDNEKALVQRITSYLAELKRTTATARNPKLREGYPPFATKHFYWYLNKHVGTWFNLYPNKNVIGSYFYPELKDCAWLLRVKIDLGRSKTINQHTAETFVSGLLSAIGLETVIVYEQDSLR